MKAKYLRLCSDLHLEGFSNSAENQVEFFIPAHEKDNESILVLAGDISSRRMQLVQFISHLIHSKRFRTVMYVPGNHELYHQHFEEWCVSVEAEFAKFDKSEFVYATSGVTIHEHSGCRFILSTLWGDGGKSLADRERVSWYLNDFRLIRCDSPDRKFTIDDMIALYKSSKTNIEQVLNTPYAGASIVVTHHMPSRRLVSERFWPRDGSDGANGGFVGECDDILAKTETSPRLWIFGHTHDCIDTSLWKTRCVSNPTGYRGEWDNGFSAGPSSVKFVEINDPQKGL